MPTSPSLVKLYFEDSEKLGEGKNGNLLHDSQRIAIMWTLERAGDAAIRMHRREAMKTIERLRKEAMTLSTRERASLAHELIVSLEENAGAGLSSDQELEIQRRVQLVKTRKAKGRPAEEVFAEIEAKLR